MGRKGQPQAAGRRRRTRAGCLARLPTGLFTRDVHAAVVDLETFAAASRMRQPSSNYTSLMRSVVLPSAIEREISDLLDLFVGVSTYILRRT